VSIEARVTAQYRASRIAETILNAAAALTAERASRNTGPLTVRDLAPFDELHIGGRRATQRFLPQLGISRNSRWLDVGAGVGGPSRQAAWRFGCHVTGIELTPEFCSAAATLTEAVGMAGQVVFVQGNALAMPFADAAFDGAFTLHAGMNIENKALLYREVHRVLKPWATFGIYDILAGPALGRMRFPVPWAAAADENFLVRIGEMRALLDDAGFAVVAAANRSGFARSFYRKMHEQAAGNPARIGLQLVMGEDYRLKIANARRNFEAGYFRPWEIVCRKR
jgi:ubiquinone/menaquinone biosynthesis C-methylase UbiE